MSATDVDDAAGADRVERRSSEEVRALLLEAAEELFSTYGFTRTSTKSIAGRAGVAEVLLFRHFGGKVNLFHEALYRPVVEALGAFVDAREGRPPPADPQDSTRTMVASLYGILQSRRGAVLALTGAQSYTSEVREVLGEHERPLRRLYLDLERALMRAAAEKDFVGLHPPVAARAAVAAVVASVVFCPWLVPERDDEEVAARDLRRELARLLHHGVLHRPG